MKIEHIELHHISMPLVHPFRTSFGVEMERSCILTAVYSQGLVGWGECVTGIGPWYSSETIGTAWHIMTEFLVPALLHQEISDPITIPDLFKATRGHPMAKAGLENAVWDLLAKREGKPLSAMLGGVRDRVEVGVSIGIQPTLQALLDRVDSFVDAGYQRIKMKIEPGWEFEPLSRVRERHPDIRLMADANSAFSLDDVALFQKLDELNLLMIEQPLSYDDIADHARLQAEIETAVCLDESIHSVSDAQAMIDLQAGRIINMKVGRVGGFSKALKIHDMSQKANIQMWCGGMLETGIGRAGNIHLASLPNFVLPGDISATDRYYAEDIADPPFVLNVEDSTMSVPTGDGIGMDVKEDRIAKARVRHYRR
ncbi:MAG: o-succinylbenzoate synthase [Chloroflexi bacterium]|nr:o-succinylbenzoate synthase [Chloroflexota bacterium]